MRLKVSARQVPTRDDKPKSLKLTITLDPETAQQLSDLALREGQPLAEMMRTLVVGSLSAYPTWGIDAADRRRAFAEQRAAILNNLYGWFAEQRWMMEHQIAQGGPPHEDPP